VLSLIKVDSCLIELKMFVPLMIYEYGERPWNDTDRGNLRNSEKNLSQRHFVHHKSHMGANPGLRGERPATNRLSYATARYRNTLKPPLL
jgi:hypothetical protein